MRTGATAAGWNRWLDRALICAPGLIVAVALKRFYSGAAADDLEWILAPTCRLAGVLSGIRFEHETAAGWISREDHIIVGPSCAGLNFMIIAFSMLYLTFAGRLRTAATRAAWLAGALGIACVLTVVTNAVRIIAATFLFGLDIYGGFVTKEGAHLAEGTLVYSLTMVLLYRAAVGFFERDPAGRSK